MSVSSIECPRPSRQTLHPKMIYWIESEFGVTNAFILCVVRSTGDSRSIIICGHSTYDQFQFSIPSGREGILRRLNNSLISLVVAGDQIIGERWTSVFILFLIAIETVTKNSKNNENKKTSRSKLGPFSGRRIETKRIARKKPFVQCKEVIGVEFFRSIVFFNAIVVVVAVGAHEIVLACR